MENKAKWIWYPGDFEMYHSIQLHSRREQLDEGGYPAFWNLKTPYPSVTFKKRFTAEKDTVVKTVSRDIGYMMVDWYRKPLNTDIPVKAGDHEIIIRVTNPCGKLPAIYIDSEYVVTDDTWLASENNAYFVSVDASPEFFSPEDDVCIFPFKYDRIDVVSRKKLSDGVLFDFGKELFGKLCITGVSEEDEIYVCYGESPEEACDKTDAIIRETISGKTEYELKARAYRYVSLTKLPREAELTGSDKVFENASVWTMYEYVPLASNAFFECDVDGVSDIWNTCKYTLHLNSREFFLDGIKRDRWVWSGDAYQSYMINDYLWFDDDLTKRTIRGLLGKPPYTQNVNTINDYTLYLIIAVQEYYERHGDKKFVESVFPSLKSLFEFFMGRRDENGFMEKIGDDWIFIDWADINKSTAKICAEQILLWRMMKAMSFIFSLMGDEASASKYSAEAKEFREKILKLYWDEEKKAFSELPGDGSVKRHANIFAVMYDFVDSDTQNVILESVLDNDDIPQITTPYFKFFELNALCKMGKIEYAQDLIDSYWGGMMKLGATSIWEQFDPTKKGTEHLAMYGMKYGCSLCHAWGAGPIYLLGRYVLGVENTDTAYKSFKVQPNPGKYKSFKGIVPVKGGEVYVEYVKNDDGTVYAAVKADVDGGVLIINGKEIPMKKGELTVYNG